MARGKFLSLEEARKHRLLDQFAKEHPNDEEEFTSVAEHGAIDGVLIHIGGGDRSIHAILDLNGEQLTGIWLSNKTIGKKLAHLLFEPVRLFGRGRWTRDADGNWNLKDFKVESFEALDDAPLTEALTDIRKIDLNFDDGSYGDLDAIRKGPSGKLNGRH